MDNVELLHANKSESDRLTVKRLDKKAMVLNYVKARKYAKTSDVVRYGLEIYHTRAMRDAYELADEGLLRRMEEERVKTIFGNIKEGVWEYCGG